jgi:YD repeat-containing protein
LDLPITTSRIKYDGVGNVIESTDANGHTTTYRYDALNRQYSMTTAVGSPCAATSWTGYDNVGNVIGSKDALNRVTTSTYDKLNRQTAVTQAVGTVDETTSRYQYDKVGNRLSETNGREYTTEYVYDALNRQIETIDAYDNHTKTQYFNTPSSVAIVLAELSLTNANVSVGKVVKTIDAAPFQNATYVLYDKFDRQIATYDATKHQTSASKYDAVDRVIESTDTLDRTTSYTYNTGANTKVTIDSLGVTRTESFDAAGNLVTFSDPIDGITRTTHYTYDKRDHQIKVKDASGGETDYVYYLDGQKASIQDAVGNLTEYVYDVAGRLTEEKTGFGIRKYEYDLVNNRIQGIDRNERITNYSYDNLDRVKTEAWGDNSQTFTYSYDKNGNRLTASDGKIRYEYGYDNTDLLETVDRINVANPNDKLTFQYTYDEIGNLIRTEEKVGASIKATTIYEYDDPRYLNTKITQTGAGLANKEVKFTYDPTTGSNTKIERYLDGLLKVTTDNAYDLHGRLIGIAQVQKKVSAWVRGLRLLLVLSSILVTGVR